MKNKKIIQCLFVFILISCNIISFVIISNKKEEIEDCWYTIDSLAKLEYVRFNEECDLFGHDEKSLLLSLPEPYYSNEVIVTSEDIESIHPSSVSMYLRRNRVDTPTHLHQYVWNNPFSKRNILDICFVFQDSVWIAVSCLEYDTCQIEF